MDWLTVIVVAVALVAVAWWVRFAGAARSYRSQLVDGYHNLEFAAEATDVGREGKKLIVALGQLGFEPIASRLTRDNTLVVLLHSESEGSVAEIVDFTHLAGTGRFVVEFTSVLEGSRGLLCTDNAATQSLHDDELRQTFLEASPTELTRYHQSAIEFLQGNGVSIEPVSRDEALATRTSWRARHLRKVEQAPLRTVLDWLRDAQGDHLASSGPIADSPKMKERLHAILESD